MSKTGERIKELGIELPPASEPMGAYVPAVTASGLVFVSGQLPRWGGEMRYTGKVDSELSAEKAGEAMRLAALNAVSVLKEHLGDLDRVLRVVKLKG